MQLPLIVHVLPMSIVRADISAHPSNHPSTIVTRAPSNMVITLSYICNYLHQQTRAPICQYLPADPIDRHVLDAFFQPSLPSNSTCSSRSKRGVSRRAPRFLLHRSKSFNASNTRLTSPVGSMIASIRITALSRVNWSADGMPRSESYNKPRRYMHTRISRPPLPHRFRLTFALPFLRSANPSLLFGAPSLGFIARLCYVASLTRSSSNA